MDKDCVEIELDLGDETLETVRRHMKRSGLAFNDAFIEILEMAIDNEEEKKARD